ncbi:MAG: 3'-5' exonuclease [Bacteroidales bacterium]|nr:3'-5' exonuclease [Bacteroidales bacterium]
MTLNLKRPLLFFDIESTGLNIPYDCIAELSFVKIMPDGEQRVKTWRMCPWDYIKGCQFPMNPSASEVNGIKDEDLAGEKKFYELAPEIASWLEDSDLAGYNSAKFDLPMLCEEFERVRKYVRGLPPSVVNLDLHSKKMVDVQTIFHKMEPRNLKAAYRFYCGGDDFENAHTAEADTIATYKVLCGQLEKYPEDQIKNDVDWLAAYTEVQKTIDFAGRLVYGPDKQPTVNFGKHKGKTCREVYRIDRGYFDWIQNADFTLDTKRQFAVIAQEIEQEKNKPLGKEDLQRGMGELADKWGSGKLF